MSLDMNRNISESLASFPEFLSSEHLVELGIYKSRDAAYQARLHGHSPNYIKLRKKILYPKQAIVEFLTTRIRSGGSPLNDPEQTSLDKESDER